MKKYQSGMVTVYLIIALALASSGLGWGLYKQVQANGAYKAQEAQFEQNIADMNAEIAAQKAEVERVNKLLVENQKKKKVIYRDREVVKNVIKEVQVNADPKACINQPVPVGINSMFAENNIHEGDGKDPPAGNPDG